MKLKNSGSNKTKKEIGKNNIRDITNSKDQKEKMNDVARKAYGELADIDPTYMSKLNKKFKEEFPDERTLSDAFQAAATSIDKSIFIDDLEVKKAYFDNAIFDLDYSSDCLIKLRELLEDQKRLEGPFKDRELRLHVLDIRLRVDQEVIPKLLWY